MLSKLNILRLTRCFPMQQFMLPVQTSAIQQNDCDRPTECPTECSEDADIDFDKLKLFQEDMEITMKFSGGFCDKVVDIPVRLRCKEHIPCKIIGKDLPTQPYKQGCQK